MPNWTTAQEKRAWQKGRAPGELGKLYYHGKWYSGVPKPGQPPVGPAPPPVTTTTTTGTTTTPGSSGGSTGGFSPGVAGQLAQDAGQIEDQAQGANAYQQMVTTPSTTAPANAGQDSAAQSAVTALQSFYGSGSADAPQYAPSSNVYAAQVAASSGAESNPT